MKKLLALVLAAILSLSLVACGGGDDTTPAPSASAPSTSEPAPTETDAPAEVEDFDWGTLLSDAFIGISDAGEGYYLGFDAEYTFAVLAVLDLDGNYVSFVGPLTENEDGSFTITDEENGLSLTFGAANMEDGTIQLDLGEELGMAYVAPCEMSELSEALNMIDAGGNSVA